VRAALLTLLLLFSVSAAYADREIFIPIGNKVPMGSARLEYFDFPAGNNRYDAFAAFGLTKSIEAEFQLDQFSSNATLGTFSTSYTFFNPIVDAVPAISVGVRDIMDKTSTGRFAYFAGTYRKSVPGAEGADISEFNFGLGIGRKVLPFGGMVLPINPAMRLLLEHDGVHGTAGVEFRPVRNFGIRFMATQRETFWSVRYSARF
jgi:hypothetical protein